MASPRSATRRHAVLEGEGARGDQGRVLAEAVAGDGAGLDAEALDRVEHHQAGHERRQLGVAGGLQLVGVGVAAAGGPTSRSAAADASSTSSQDG